MKSETITHRTSWLGGSHLYFRFGDSQFWVCVGVLAILQAFMIFLNIYHMLLTPWTSWKRVLPEKLTERQLLEKFFAFCGTRMFITAFTWACSNPRLMYLFRNMVKYLWWWVLSTLSNHLLPSFSLVAYPGSLFSLRSTFRVYVGGSSYVWFQLTKYKSLSIQSDITRVYFLLIYPFALCFIWIVCPCFDLTFGIMSHFSFSNVLY